MTWLITVKTYIGTLAIEWPASVWTLRT